MNAVSNLTIQQLADFAGHHALLLFGIGTALLLLAAAVVWYLIGRYGERLQQWVVTGARRLLRLVDARLLKGRLGSIESGEYLVLHTVVGFAVVFPALVIFFELTDALTREDELGQFDHALAQTLRQTVTDSTYQFFAVMTHFGDVSVLTVLTVVVAIILAWCRQWLLLAGWLTAVIGNGLLTRGLKALFQRLRPLHDHGYAMAEGWSFPSGHSSSALVVYGMLAYFLMRVAHRPWQLPIATLVILLILTVGASRIFLQVHFFSDVIAGFCAGAAWLTVCMAGTDLALRQRRSL